MWFESLFVYICPHFELLFFIFACIILFPSTTKQKSAKCKKILCSCCRTSCTMDPTKYSYESSVSNRKFWLTIFREVTCAHFQIWYSFSVESFNIAHLLHIVTTSCSHNCSNLISVYIFEEGLFEFEFRSCAPLFCIFQIILWWASDQIFKKNESSRVNFILFRKIKLRNEQKIVRNKSFVMSFIVQQEQASWCHCQLRSPEYKTEIYICFRCTYFNTVI